VSGGSSATCRKVVDIPSGHGSSNGKRKDDGGPRNDLDHGQQRVSLQVFDCVLDSDDLGLSCVSSCSLSLGVIRSHT